MKLCDKNDGQPRIKIGLSGLQNQDVYAVFVDWIATPQRLRQPETQKAFSQRYKIHQNTLTEWKKRPQFFDHVRRRIKTNSLDDLGTVLDAFKRRIIEKPSGSDVKVFLEYMGDFEQRISFKDEPTESGLSKERIEEIRVAVKNLGLDGLIDFSENKSTFPDC